MLQQILDRVPAKVRSDKRILGLLAACFVLVFAVSVFWAVSSGESADDKDPDATPVPMLPETEIRRFVEATIVAYIPTPVPTATPNVPATVAADLAAQRVTADRVVAVNPLASGASRNPFLTPAEIEHLNSLGPSLWLNVRLWLVLRDLLLEPGVVWEQSELQEVSLRLQELMDEQDRFRLDRLSEQVGETVRAYTREYEVAVGELHRGASAVLRMRALISGLDGRVLTSEELDSLLGYQTDVSDGVRNFHLFMSNYGCSICGELYRTVEP